MAGHATRERSADQRSLHRDFEGVVVRRDDDGFGLVEFEGGGSGAPEIGVFGYEVLQNPVIDRGCKVGQKVVGRAENRHGGFRVLHLDLKR